MQKIILDTIEEFRNTLLTPDPIAKGFFHWKAIDKFGEVDIDQVESFLKQALTNAFEAGQKSREKEIVDSYNKALGDMFIKIAELAEPDERQTSAGDLHTNMDNIHEIRQSLSLTKESK